MLFLIEKHYKFAPIALQVRQLAVDQLTREADASDHMQMQLKYQRAERALKAGHSQSLTRFCPQRRAQRVQHIMKMSASTSLPVITEILQQQCQQGNAVHACLDSFRTNPAAVRNWRLLWWSLPRHVRQEALLKLFRTFPEDYVFMGRKVCKVAFMRLVGCGAQLITELRQAAQHGAVARTEVREWKSSAGIFNISRPKRYLDAAQWIQCYAESYGEMSPMSGIIFLPSGRMQLYYAEYLYDNKNLQNLARLDGKAAEHKTLLKAWQVDCFWVQVARSESQFVKCGVCEFLRGLLDSTPRSNPSLLEVVRARLGKHWAFQSAQRLAMARIEEACIQSAGDEWPGPQLIWSDLV